MIWILLALVHPQANASYQRDYMKIKICDELRVNLREMSVESCFQGKFKFTQREDVLDFQWRLKRGGIECVGTVYDDASSVHIDGCYK